MRRVTSPGRPRFSPLGNLRRGASRDGSLGPPGPSPGSQSGRFAGSLRPGASRNGSLAAMGARGRRAAEESPFPFSSRPSAIFPPPCLVGSFEPRGFGPSRGHGWSKKPETWARRRRAFHIRRGAQSIRADERPDAPDSGAFGQSVRTDEGPPRCGPADRVSTDMGSRPARAASRILCAHPLTSPRRHRVATPTHFPAPPPSTRYPPIGLDVSRSIGQFLRPFRRRPASEKQPGSLPKDPKPKLTNP
jgi:hypothetical protein